MRLTLPQKLQNKKNIIFVIFFSEPAHCDINAKCNSTNLWYGEWAVYNTRPLGYGAEVLLRINIVCALNRYMFSDTSNRSRALDTHNATMQHNNNWMSECTESVIVNANNNI